MALGRDAPPRRDPPASRTQGFQLDRFTAFILFRCLIIHDHRRNLARRGMQFLVFGSLHGIYPVVNHIWRNFGPKTLQAEGFARRAGKCCRSSTVCPGRLRLLPGNRRCFGAAYAGGNDGPAWRGGVGPAKTPASGSCCRLCLSVLWFAAVRSWSGCSRIPRKSWAVSARPGFHGMSGPAPRYAIG